MVWTYASLGIVSFVSGCAFFLCFRKGRKWSPNAVMLEAVRVETNPEPSPSSHEKLGDFKQ